MLSKDIRRKFLLYFQSHSHQVVRSSPVIPHDDPTLLFVNAGMNQFKDVFLGKDKRPYTRATSSQKCVRVGGKHNDLENVGHTTRHLTFFEMLGNFSFGDYFKKEAIDFAWDISTHVFDFDEDKIWASIYEDDDEAFELWKKHLPEKKIVRFGKKENFWEMGETGPCGPCSELLFDRGEKYSDAASPIYDLTGERYLEFWNLVFMQYNKDEKELLTDLPAQSIDTGAGLERIISLKMGVDNVFQTDILGSLIKEQEKLFKIKYDIKNSKLAPAFHVIADHIRMLCFSIADGAVPSNIDRGYVLRKILRRAVRYGKELGQGQPFLAKLVPSLITLMGEDYPELNDSQDRIQEILTKEEEAFFRTLQKGGNVLSKIIEKTKEKISGEDAFKLKDTYGFPIEEIVLLAKDAHLVVDLEKFEKLEEEAKEKSRKAQKKEKQMFSKNLFADFSRTHGPTEFLGYEKSETDTHIVAIAKDEAFVDSLVKGDEALIVVEATPFYAEGGGQIGDQGKIIRGDAVFAVSNSFSPYNGIIAHEGTLISGTLKKQDKVTVEINKERRQKICNNHTATHLLHWALCEVLGSHVKQSGSLVTDQRLRFDFSHHKALTEDEIRRIEMMVNEKIRTDLPLDIYQKEYVEIEKDPKIKQFFGEKYAEKVRVIDIDFSKELCGGTHVERLGQIGFLKIAKESSIAAGIRRIDAVTAVGAEDYVYEKEDLLNWILSTLKTQEVKVKTRLNTLIDENKELQKRIKQSQKDTIDLTAQSLISKVEKIKDIPAVFAEIDISSKDFPLLAEKVLKKEKSLCLVLATKDKGRCQFFICLTDDLVKKGLSAQNLVKEISDIIGGGGGGRDNIAQAGGTKCEQIQKAFDHIKQILKKL